MFFFNLIFWCMVYLIYVDCFSIYHRVDGKFPRTDYPLRWLKNNEDNRYVQRSTILHKNLQWEVSVSASASLCLSHLSLSHLFLFCLFLEIKLLKHHIGCMYKKCLFIDLNNNNCKVIRVEHAYNHRQVRPAYNKQR